MPRSSTRCQKKQIESETSGLQNLQLSKDLLGRGNGFPWLMRFRNGIGKRTGAAVHAIFLSKNLNVLLCVGKGCETCLVLGRRQVDALAETFDLPNLSGKKV